MANVERDPITGTETTGHEWDGIKELNNPLPKWWVYVFIISIVWSIVWYVLYPSFPLVLGNGMMDREGDGQAVEVVLTGIEGYSSRQELETAMVDLKQMRQDTWLSKMEGKSLDQIAADTELRAYARRGGEVVFKENCAPCHQSGGAGEPVQGYPNLTDNEWIFGGTLDEIKQTVTHGVRWPTDDETRVGEMLSYAGNDTFSDEEKTQVAEYVISLSNGSPAAGSPGEQLFLDNCAACHMDDGSGNPDLASPPLNNQNWTYQPQGEGSVAAILAQMNGPRHGQMPAWGERLNETEINQVVLYIESRGGTR